MIERVHFTKPLLKQLNAEGYSCVDMHYHTQYSDTYTRIKNILKKCEKKEIGVAITDHNEIKGCIDAEKKNKKFGALVIPGIEASCREGSHFLIYFYSLSELKEYNDKVIKKNLTRNPHLSSLSFRDLLEKTEKYNCVISAAHPFNVLPWNLQKKVESGKMDISLLKKIPAFEVINGLMVRKTNLKAVEWARECDKAITAGSDGHTLRMLGSAVTCAKADDVDSFLKAILKHKNIVAGTETKTGSRVISNMKAISKQSRYAGRSLKIHYDLRLKGKIKPKVKEKLGKVKERFI
ncbi:PHP domain-containing protein [candidate division KSB1 bacterium]